jgi:hypothetical protein
MPISMIIGAFLGFAPAKMTGALAGAPKEVIVRAEQEMLPAALH